MPKKKKQVAQEVTVDKMDTFLKQNYKGIMAVVLGAIVIFLGGYGVISLMKNSEKSKTELIGEIELGGLSTPEELEKYSQMAQKLTFAKDYIHLTAGDKWLSLDNKTQAASELAMVDGKLSEYAKSLLYDMGEIKTIDPQLFKGTFSPLWYYRAVMAAPESSRSALIAEFRSKWPDNALLAQIDKWGIK